MKEDYDETERHWQSICASVKEKANPHNMEVTWTVPWWVWVLMAYILFKICVIVSYL